MKENVKKAIEQLMEQGGDEERRRKRAREIKEMTHKAVEDVKYCNNFDIVK
ncbi:unnamed protein product [Sphenostylis stenocarpa]|uniref:Uncharacterized protein n=1 Tax=Sphenostylis stenocarpa TaxID=92480 RepID=A0AA86SDS9_9FABA|nr:unnamed protein product [Sphenostylis stenocarpa]